MENKDDIIYFYSLGADSRLTKKGIDEDIISLTQKNIFTEKAKLLKET
jgi:hypothetical protein